MKRFKLKQLSVLLFFAIIFASCSNDDSLTEPKIDLKFNTITTPFVLKSTQSTKELAFTSGYIQLKAIEFEAETENDSIEIEFELEMDTKIDFATGETTPDISFVVIPAGTYEEIEVEVELQDDFETPAIVLYGTYVDIDGVNHDVQFEYNSGETFELEKEGTINFLANESALAQITIDPSAWFAAVTNEQLSSASKVNGVIVISKNYNSDIFNIVADGLDLAKDVEINQ